MNKLLTLALILISLSCFGQKKEITNIDPIKSSLHTSDKLEKSKDTLSIPVNQVQMSILADKEKALNESQQKFAQAQKDYANAIELLLGVKQEEIESIQLKNGVFKVTKKK